MLSPEKIIESKKDHKDYGGETMKKIEEGY